MRDSWPLLKRVSFPQVTRRRLSTLQMNLGYLCNLACVHCHVAAGPRRTELMDRPTMDLALRVVEQRGISVLDLTGGSPEMNPDFPYLVRVARQAGVHVMDRCNPTILNEPGYEWVADFLAGHRVEIVASLPCYSAENVEQQRGKGAWDRSIMGLRRLNRLGYGRPDGDLVLNLVYNPVGATLPPDQGALEADYRRVLGERFDIRFNRLFTLANMPIKRFGSMLISQGRFDSYLALLRSAHQEKNVNEVMCRDLVSVDWQGYLYDCDFNQMLGLPLGGRSGMHLRDLLSEDLEGRDIAVAGHCYGCTAGQGSSCGGALS